MSQLTDDFVRVFDLPDAMLPYIDQVATEQEMRLVVAMNGQAMTVEEVAALMELPADEAATLVRRAYSRIILRRTTKLPPHSYTPVTFYHRISNVARYEKWGDIPAEVRDEVIRWELEEWVKHWQSTVAEFDTNPEAYRRMPNHDFLLLAEALEMVDAASDHAVIACDCRAITQGCEQPAESCIRLGEGAVNTLERGMGRRITREECHDLVVRLDKRGLMHTGDWAWKERGGVFGFCNCCTCDCFPIRGGLAFGLRGKFPRAHYFAERDEAKCEQCGVCVNRCYYDAYYFDGTTVLINGKERKHVAFDPDRCWGCGLCSTGCTRSAITMVPVPQDVAASIPQIEEPHA